MAKSKFFRIGVEGATSDGRTIERSWIQDMADTYSPATYGARINLEHIRGIIPESPFKAYGDVTALRAEEITEGALKGKLALYAQVEPTPDLVAMTKAKQKIYPSMEVSPKFAATGKAYLVGLAVTDSPASLGTEMMQFAAQHPNANPLASRKQSPDNLFTAATEAVEIEFEEEPSDSSLGDVLKGIKERFAKLAGRTNAQDARFGEIVEAFAEASSSIEAFVNQQTAATKALTDRIDNLFARIDAAEKAAKKNADDIAALSAVPTTPARKPHPGGNGAQLTNC